MGEVVCTLTYRESDQRDLVLPDHVPVHQLVNSIAAALGMPMGKKYFYELAIVEEQAVRRIPGTRTLCQAYILNGSSLQLIQEKNEQGRTVFLVDESGVRFRLRENTVVGRLTREVHVDVDLTALDTQKVISRQHAVITHVSHSYVIKDSNSRNGTFVNDQKIPEGQLVSLHTGDMICFGSLEKGVRLRFEIS